MAEAADGESALSKGYFASVPAAVRRRLGLEPGDTLRWHVEGNAIRIEIHKKAGRAFADFAPVDFGVDTHGAADHDDVI